MTEQKSYRFAPPIKTDDSSYASLATTSSQSPAPLVIQTGQLSTELTSVSGTRPNDGSKESSGKKFDGGKTPAWQGLVQYFPNALLAVADVSRYGAQKYKLSYDDVNWARVDGGLGRYRDALFRHILNEQGGSELDPESNLHHAAHAAWNALAVLELVLKKKQ